MHKLRKIINQVILNKKSFVNVCSICNGYGVVGV